MRHRSILRPPLPGMGSLVVPTIKVTNSFAIAARSASAISATTAAMTKTYLGMSLDCVIVGHMYKVSTRDPKERPAPAIAARIVT